MMTKIQMILILHVKLFKSLNKRVKTVKLKQNKTHGIGISNIFLDMTSKENTTKENTDKLNFKKMKNFCVKCYHQQSQRWFMALVDNI